MIGFIGHCCLTLDMSMYMKTCDLSLCSIFDICETPVDSQILENLSFSLLLQT